MPVFKAAGRGLWKEGRKAARKRPKRSLLLLLPPQFALGMPMASLGTENHDKWGQWNTDKKLGSILASPKEKLHGNHNILEIYNTKINVS